MARESERALTYFWEGIRKTFHQSNQATHLKVSPRSVKKRDVNHFKDFIALQKRPPTPSRRLGNALQSDLSSLTAYNATAQIVSLVRWVLINVPRTHNINQKLCRLFGIPYTRIAAFRFMLLAWSQLRRKFKLMAYKVQHHFLKNNIDQVEKLWDTHMCYGLSLLQQL